ncbi:MAG: hypothetical protein WDM81_19460 [Rhizomicrobium sp.]
MKAPMPWKRGWGLEGHARVIVMHEKNGRQHFHPIWSRIDLLEMRAVPDSHNYRAHEEVSRDLERRFGHPRVQGAHAERDHADRPERTPDIAELKQEERTGIDGKRVKEEVTAIFRSSDSAQAFAAGLEDNGYVLAKGDRRDFVIVDREGGIHSLSRRIEGLKAGALHEFMNPLAGQITLSADEAKQLQLDRSAGRDEIAWEDSLLQSALASEAKDRQEKLDNRRTLEWEDQLIKAAEAKAKAEDAVEREQNRKLREGRQEARDEAMLANKYGSGADYVNQSTAAMKHHLRRQEDSNTAKPLSPENHEDVLLRRQAEETTKRQQAEAEVFSPKVDSPSMSGGAEMTDAIQARLSRIQAMQEEQNTRGFDDDPDRQREALGEGRTRSR